MLKEKKCAECRKVFQPKSGTQRYCSGPHVAVCEFCGKPFQYSCSPKEKPRYCSQRCINDGKRRTVQAKYGVENVSQLDTVRKKISDANSSDEVQAKRRQTSLQNWGVDNPAKSELVKAKMSEVMSSDEYLDNRRQTCIERYGTESPMQNAAVKEKQRQTNVEKYGSAGHPHTREDFMKMMVDSSKVDEYLSFREDPAAYIDSHYTEPPTISMLEEDLGVTDTPIYNILISHNCSDMISHSHSNMEEEVVQYLKSILPPTTILRNDRTVIKPQEIDIYLPEYKIGIECNPASTHNSSKSDPWGAPPKSYKYHQTKSLLAQEKGVFLFHIFGYEWVNRRDIIQSMLMNLFHENVYSIGARETEVKILSTSTCKKFLEENHRQGYTAFNLGLGLVVKGTDKIVSVMTFSHTRPTMGRRDSDDEGSWELSRFCSASGTNVCGGASKLFKYFLKTVNPSKVISFSDIAHTRGGLYETLGFTQVSVSSPSYVWSDIYDAKYFHRVSCQKRHLRKLFNDDTIDIDHMTEREIMESRGFVRVYDCGVIRWEYTV